MADVINIGVSGLLSIQRALATTGHNITNANTEGYSRQIVNFEAREPNRIGGTYIGNGVDVTSVTRVVDQYAKSTLNKNISSYNYQSMLANMASQVDELVADPNIGLSQTMSNFFDAVNGVMRDPISISQRQVLLSQGEILVERFGALDERFRNLSSSVDSQYSQFTQEINSLASSIAKLNTEIIEATGNSVTGQPNDLLDQRDKLLSNLAEIIDVNTMTAQDGSFYVTIGSGVPLVYGSQVNTLQTRLSTYDKSEYEIVLNLSGSLGTLDLSNVGGKIGALTYFRDNILTNARNSVGQLAIGLSQTFNAQHRLGVDLNGALGTDFFTPVNMVSAARSQNNNGTGTLDVTISDVNNLTNSDYKVIYSGGYQVIRMSDGKNLGTFNSGTINLASEGISFTPNGLIQSGDSFLIRPTRQAASSLKINLTNGSQIAVGNPVKSIKGYVDTNGNVVEANTGTGTITVPVVTDTSSNSDFSQPGTLKTPLRIVINKHLVSTKPTTYSYDYDIVDLTKNPSPPPTKPLPGQIIAHGNSFTPGIDNKILSAIPGANFGYDFTINGDPDDGDVFEIHFNIDGASDNNNGTYLADLRTKPLLLNSSSTYNELYSKMVAEAGNKTREANISQTATQSLMRQSQAYSDSISGVNLDEEAAKLIALQNAYQACAQLIRAGSTILDTLIGAMR